MILISTWKRLIAAAAGIHKIQGIGILEHQGNAARRQNCFGLTASLVEMKQKKFYLLPD